MGITSYGVKGKIGAALDAITPKSNDLAITSMAIESTLAAGQSEDLSFLGAVPALSEWAGQRNTGQPIEYDYTIRNRKFESSIMLPKSWINNDKTGLVDLRIAQLSQRMVNHRGQLIADLLNTVGTAFNGTAFFSDSHSWGNSGTIDNNLSYTAATGTDPTADEAAGAILQAWQQMMSFKDDRGEPINEGAEKFAVIVPANYMAAHLQALTQDNLDTGSGVRSNPVFGLTRNGFQFTLIGSPRITTTTKMVLARIDEGWQPFVYQENIGERAVSLLDDSSDFAFDNDAWKAGIKCVDNAGYGLFTSAVLTTYA